MNRKTPVILSRHLNPTLAAVGALIASVVVAYGADSIFSQLRQQTQSTLHIVPVALFAAMMPLVLAALMLALAWVTLIRLPPSRAVSIIFLTAGSIVIGTYLTQLTGFPIELRNTIIGRFRTTIMNLGTHSSLYHLTSFWIILGLACLMRRSVKTKTSPIEKNGKNAA